MTNNIPDYAVIAYFHELDIPNRLFQGTLEQCQEAAVKVASKLDLPLLEMPPEGATLDANFFDSISIHVVPFSYQPQIVGTVSADGKTFEYDYGDDEIVAAQLIGTTKLLPGETAFVIPIVSCQTMVDREIVDLISIDLERADRNTWTTSF